MTLMTDSAAATETDTARRTQWSAVQAGLWVGRRDGEFAGMIEQIWGSGYQVTTRLGKTLGVFGTMEEAQQALR